MNRSNGLWVFCLSLALANAAKGQDAFRRWSDSLAGAYFEQAAAGALVIGLHDNGRERIFYYGAPADSASVFEIGALTEPFTCLAYARAGLEGTIGLDDLLAAYLPANVATPVYEKIVCRRADAGEDNPFGDGEEVSIRFSPLVCVPDSSVKPQPIRLCYLATHTSGLPDEPSNLQGDRHDPFAGYTARDLYDFLDAFRIDDPIGFDYRHSTLGMALLGHALELKTGLGYDGLLRPLLDSLGMKDTRATLDAAMAARLLPGHDAKGRDVPPWDYGVLTPAGGLHSTPADMMRFLAGNVDPDKSYVVNLLDYTHNPRLKYSGARGAEMEIALGWKVTPLPAPPFRAVWNGGTTGGYAAYLGFNEANHTGVVVLSSQARPVRPLGEALLGKLTRFKL